MRTQPDSSEPLLNKREAAQLINYSQRTIDNWIKLKKIPYVKFGAGIRFIRADLQRFIDSHRIG